MCAHSCLRNVSNAARQTTELTAPCLLVWHTLCFTAAPDPRPESLSLNVKLIVSKIWCDAPFSGCEEDTISPASYKHLHSRWRLPCWSHFYSERVTLNKNLTLIDDWTFVLTVIHNLCFASKLYLLLLLGMLCVYSFGPGNYCFG